ncbi:hypothetical protein BOTCAL_0591g00010 [Botryotinia calthae]|uniref:Uncharacterized protein n=1 Tax=Botryotinia calthae TaxID=38488 RepID=A0A4Y8CKV6_9HELO|nr:hypothetical protein BOTCAL_0591g00010 [Botryotinia calthae]
MLVLFLPLFLGVVEGLLKPDLPAGNETPTENCFGADWGLDLQVASQQPKITVALLAQKKQIFIVTQSSGSNNSKLLRKGLAQYVYATNIVVNFFPNGRESISSSSKYYPQISQILPIIAVARGRNPVRQTRAPTTLATVNFPFPIELFLAIFAARSALAFPSTPECAGTYRNSTSSSSTLKASDAMIPGTINYSALGSFSNFFSEFRN